MKTIEQTLEVLYKYRDGCQNTINTFKRKVAVEPNIPYLLSWSAQSTFEAGTRLQILDKTIAALQNVRDSIGEATLETITKYALDEVLRLTSNGPTNSTNMFENFGKQIEARTWAEIYEEITCGY